MITRLEELKVRRTQEALEGTSPNSIEITVNDEIPIMVEEYCGRKGKRVRGLGSFPRLEIPTSFSIPANSEWITMQENVIQLSLTIQTMQLENKRLKKMLTSVLKKKNIEKTNSSNLHDDVPDNETQGNGDYVLNEEDVETQADDDDEEEDEDLNDVDMDLNDGDLNDDDV